MLLLCPRPPGRWETPYERRFGEPFKGPVTPFRATVDCHPISSRDLSRLHQFGKKVLPGLFLGYALYAGGIWKRDILVAYIEELEKMFASEIHPRTLDAKEVLTPMRSENSIFPVRRWNSNIVWKRRRIPRTHTKAGTTCEGVKISEMNFKANRKSLNRQNQKLTLKPEMTCVQSKVSSFIVVTLNVEFNSTCRRKKHSQFH